MADAPEEAKTKKRKKRQEQEHAREEVTEVAPNVLRMELPIQIPGLGHVNCYALVDNEGAAVVDPGLPTPGSFRALKQRLGQAGLKVKDIHTVIVTHSHPDHFGGANHIVKESGARLMAHMSFRLGSARPTEAEVSVDDLHAHEHVHVCHHDGGSMSGEVTGEVTADGSAEGAAEDGSDGEAHEGGPPYRAPFTPELSRTAAARTPWGGDHPRPPFKMRMRWRLMRLLQRGWIFPTVSHPLAGGDVIRLAGREWIVVHTPGHTEDHVCLHDPTEEVFLAGDHVLPSITPHISGLTLNPDPLAAFFDSLDRAASIPHVNQVLPAHGHPFSDLAERCEAIKLHHDERLEKVRAIASDIGPASVEAFTRKLFRRRSWGAMAESETYAHLEHMRLLGAAEARKGPDGILIYEF